MFKPHFHFLSKFRTQLRHFLSRFRLPHVPRLSFGHRKPHFTKKTILISVLLILFLSLSGVAVSAYYVLTHQAPTTYDLHLETRLLENNEIILNQNQPTPIQGTIIIQTPKWQLPTAQSPQLTVAIKVGSQVLKQVTLPTTDQPEQPFSLQLEPAALLEGNHAAVVVVFSSHTPNTAVAEQSFKLVTDQTPPHLTGISLAEKGYATLATPSAKLAASSSAILAKVVSSQTKQLSVTFTFNEPASLAITDQKSNVIFTATEASTSATALISTVASRELHQITLVDKSGNNLTGKLEYTIDAAPPQVTITSPTALNKSAASNYTFSFTVNEKTIDLKVTQTDQLKPHTYNSSTKTYEVKSVALTQGENTFHIAGADMVGNPLHTTISVVVNPDPTPPPAPVSNPSSNSNSTSNSNPGSTSAYEYYHGQECPYCATVNNFLSSWSNPKNISINRYEIWHNTDNKSRASSRAASCGLNSYGVPLLYTPSGQCIVGDSPVISFLSGL